MTGIEYVLKCQVYQDDDISFKCIIKLHFRTNNPYFKGSELYLRIIFEVFPIDSPLLCINQLYVYF